MKYSKRMEKYYRNIFRGFFLEHTFFLDFIIRKIVRFNQLEIHARRVNHASLLRNMQYIFIRLFEIITRTASENVEI